MDSFEFNKIAGAILFSLLVLFGLRNLGAVIYGVEPLEKPAYNVPGMPAPTEGAAAPAEAAGPSFAEALASADPAKGKSVAAKCQTCHSIEKGGPNKIGPDLWGVVGRPVATHGGFQYSDALKKIGGNWDFEKLEHFIRHPRDFAPGTKMTFPGLPDVKDRANVIAYLNTQSDAPLPIPAAPAVATTPAAAPANPGQGGAPAAAPAEGSTSGASGEGQPFPAKSQNPASENQVVVPSQHPDSGVGSNVNKPEGNVSAPGQEKQEENRGAAPLNEAIPAPAAKSPEGAGHNPNSAQPEEQQETHPVR